MDTRPTPMDPDEARRRFAARLEEADLPRFTSAMHDPTGDLLEISWDHGVTLFMDLTGEDVAGPIDDEERAVILGLAPCCEQCEPIDVYVPSSADDPRSDTSNPGVRIHRGPPLHPDDVTTVDGIPVTTPSRTLIDMAEVSTADELRAMFARAPEIGLLDPMALRAARARVEWRPSLELLDEVIAEHCG
jgi:hypothetical protein